MPRQKSRVKLPVDIFILAVEHFQSSKLKGKKERSPIVEKVRLSVSAHSGSLPMNWFWLSVVLQRIGMILVSKNICDYYVLVIAYGWGSVQYFSAHMGYNDQILSLLFHSPHSCRQSPFCLDFGNLIAGNVHSDTPVQHVRDVKSEVLTPDFQRCIVIHRLLTPQQANLYLLPDWLRASLMLATPIPPFLASCPFPSFPPPGRKHGKAQPSPEAHDQNIASDCFQPEV